MSSDAPGGREGRWRTVGCSRPMHRVRVLGHLVHHDAPPHCLQRLNLSRGGQLAQQQETPARTSTVTG